MAQAFKDDRCASCADASGALANAWTQFDANVLAAFNGMPAPTADGPSTRSTSIPLGRCQGSGYAGNVAGVAGVSRCTVSYVGSSSALASRWYSMLDDMTFDTTGCRPPARLTGRALQLGLPAQAAALVQSSPGESLGRRVRRPCAGGRYQRDGLHRQRHRGRHEPDAGLE